MPPEVIQMTSEQLEQHTTKARQDGAMSVIAGGVFGSKGASAQQGTDQKGYTPELMGTVRALRAYAIMQHTKGTVRMDDLLKRWSKDSTRGFSKAIDEVAHVKYTVMNESNFNLGGALVQTDFLDEIIETARKKTIMDKVGLKVSTTTQSSVSRRKRFLTYDFTDQANIGEQQRKPVIMPLAYGNHKIDIHKKAYIALMSRELLDDGDPNADKELADAIIDVLSNKRDYDLMLSAGGVNKHKGVFNLIASGYTVTSTATAGDEEAIDGELDQMIAKVEDNSEGEIVNGGWLTHPAILRKLWALRTSLGSRFYEELLDGKLKGYPIHTSNKLLVSGTYKFGFFDFAQYNLVERKTEAIRFMESGAVEVYNSTTSAYETISLDSRDLVAFDITAREGFDTLSDTAGVEMTSIDW